MTIILTTYAASSSPVIFNDLAAIEIGAHPSSINLDIDYGFNNEEVLSSGDLKNFLDSGLGFLTIQGRTITNTNSDEVFGDYTKANYKCEAFAVTQSDWAPAGLKYNITYTYSVFTNFSVPNEVRATNSVGDAVQVESNFDSTVQTLTISINAIPDCRFDGQLLILGK